ncbi:MAG: sigma-70 family RNA polymerase sigma factor [Isosphaeraceae bacterium]|nr:sigma-70 family RNA polymerase sigma factor [Isosphaeraceae bacterium]
MRNHRLDSDADGLTPLDSETTALLGAPKERELLRDLAECKAKLTEALERIDTTSPESHEEGPALAHYVATLSASSGEYEAGLGALARRYSDLRGRLAMANMRLVAHVAKRFRDRGIAYSDLMQEGFCGLLEAIDRFDLGHETKLATYATWWIRQAMQRAVAAGAYPVRLSPRHLRQLAQNQDEIERGGKRSAGGSGEEGSSEMIQRIHTATRPTLSLDASLDVETNFSLQHTMSDPDGDAIADVDLDETVTKLMDGLRPREQEVLALRFGLGGGDRLSLSQVGKVLSVSKERVRQIQDRALEKLRSKASERDLVEV